MRTRFAAAFALVTLGLGAPLGERVTVAATVQSGIYGLLAAPEYPQAAKAARAAGFGLAVVNAKRGQLDVLQANGLKALAALWLRRDAVKSDEAWKQELARVRDSILQVRDHPALFAWYLTDEPDGAGISVERVKEVCAAVRALDPKTPLFANFNDPGKWGPYLELFDIVAVDPYLRRNWRGQYAPVTVVSEWLEQIHADLKKRDLDRRVFVVLGAFDLRPKDGSARRYRKPTPEEWKTMYGLARRAGVDGVLVYTYAMGTTDLNHGWNLPAEDPPLWAAIGDVINGRQ